MEQGRHEELRQGAYYDLYIQSRQNGGSAVTAPEGVRSSWRATMSKSRTCSAGSGLVVRKSFYTRIS